MTKFSKKYTDYHFHPEISDNFEIVCYERKDAGFDVYIFEKRIRFRNLKNLVSTNFIYF